MDAKRADHCINYAMSEFEETIKYTYEMHHDPGDSPELLFDLEEGTDEPAQPGKDTVTPSSLRIEDEKVHLNKVSRKSLVFPEPAMTNKEKKQ